MPKHRQVIILWLSMLWKLSLREEQGCQPDVNEYKINMARVRRRLLRKSLEKFKCYSLTRYCTLNIIAPESPCLPSWDVKRATAFQSWASSYMCEFVYCSVFIIARSVLVWQCCYKLVAVKVVFPCPSTGSSSKRRRGYFVSTRVYREINCARLGQDSRSVASIDAVC